MNKQIPNITILGSGRSGTSALAGTLASSGYNVGDNYIIPGDSNPKGFFEDREVNEINEEILFNTYPKKYPFETEPLECNTFGWKRWLARVQLDSILYTSDEIKEKIKKKIKKEPFCYKDPRFCYTLPIWKPFLKNTVFVCIFRNPALSAESMIRECETADYLKGFPMNFSTAIEIWTLMYRHILENHMPDGKWLFLNYDELFDSKGFEKLERFLNIKINKSFIDKKLQRTSFSHSISTETELIYKKLCKLAEYDKVRF